MGGFAGGEASFHWYGKLFSEPAPMHARPLPLVHGSVCLVMTVGFAVLEKNPCERKSAVSTLTAVETANRILHACQVLKILEAEL
jgi:hypothetical protein